MGAAVNAADLQITRHRTKEDSKEEAMVVLFCALFWVNNENESVLHFMSHCHIPMFLARSIDNIEVHIHPLGTFDHEMCSPYSIIIVA